MKTNLNVNALLKSSSGQTLLIQSSTSNANVRIPKSIFWEDINLPDDWLLNNESYQDNI